MASLLSCSCTENGGSQEVCIGVIRVIGTSIVASVVQDDDDNGEGHDEAEYLTTRLQDCM